MAALGLGERGRSVERRRCIPCVELEEIALLREEARVRHRDDPPVVAAVGLDVRDQPRAGQLGDVRFEEALDDLIGLGPVESAMMEARSRFVVGSQRQEVSGRAHRRRRTFGDARKDRIELGVRDQVGRRRVEAVETFRHRAELGLERGDVLHRVRSLPGKLGVPRDLVDACFRTAGLALALGHACRRPGESARSTSCRRGDDPLHRGRRDPAQPFIRLSAGRQPLRSRLRPPRPHSHAPQSALTE